MGFTLVIDNYDSFTWNIYADIATLGGNPLVRRNDKITITEIEQMLANGHLDRIVISPGPGHPQTDSGISREVITWGLGKVPILGVCMGLECLVDVLGGDIAYAGEIKHGKTSLVQHDSIGIFNGLPPLLSSTRYHSLSANVLSLPKELAVSATTQESGVIMGVRHRTYACEAVQYHPESCMSEGGRGLMANFLRLKGGYWGGENAWCGVEASPSSSTSAGVNGGAHIANGVNGSSHSKPGPSINGAPSVPTILEKIHAQRLMDVDESLVLPWSTQANITTSLGLHASPPLLSFVDRISSTRHTAVMAEVKRASPSKGDIAPLTSAPAQAVKYARAGASVISVLTEPKWFKGSLLDMLAVRLALDSLPNRPAVLRKDFILSTYQIDEARLYGADTVLLIVAMLEPNLLKELYTYSVGLGMEPLVEVNNPDELKVALDLGAKVIGVNNRNLHDFNVDMGTTSRVNAALGGRNVILCALSGISAPSDVEKYVNEGVRAVLVGEALMRAEDPTAFLRSLIGLPVLPPPQTHRPLVKVCGIRTPEDAQMAIAAGADLLGVILVPGAKRRIDYSTACEISGLVRAARAKSAYRPEAMPETTESWFEANARHLRSRKKPLIVGVFANQPLEEILGAVEEIGLDMVQLHGSELQSWARHIPVPVVKVFKVSSDGTVTGGEIGRSGLNQFILLDAAGGGGEGKTFPWEHAKSLLGDGPDRLPVFLAGGLGPDNVEQAVRELPGLLGVDSSSGTELDGRKDKAKVEGYIAAALSSS